MPSKATEETFVPWSPTATFPAGPDSGEINLDSLTHHGEDSKKNLKSEYHIDSSKSEYYQDAFSQVRLAFHDCVSPDFAGVLQAQN